MAQADVPSMKVSSMKSMFEKPKKSDQESSAQPPRRRQLRGDWVNGNGVAAKDGNQKVVKEGYYEEKEGVVRPPTAGTKERPSYSLSSDFLKSRAAMFDAPAPKQYTPKNKVSTKSDSGPKEVVNANPQDSDLNYELSSSLKDTKKMFENGDSKENEEPAEPEPQTTETVEQEPEEPTQEAYTEEPEAVPEPAAPEQEEEPEVEEQTPEPQQEEAYEEEPQQLEEPEQQEEQQVEDEVAAQPEDEIAPEPEEQAPEPEEQEQTEEPEAEQEASQDDYPADEPAVDEDVPTEEADAAQVTNEEADEDTNYLE